MSGPWSAPSEPETASPATGGAAGPAVARADGVIERPGQQRWEFARAFVEHSWARPGADRPAARPHVVLLVATLAAAVALGAGVAVQLIWPAKLDKTATRAKAAGTAGAFTAVAGWDCPTTTNSGFDAVGRQASWYTAPDGGWAGDGCHGTYEMIPMSGQATADDPGQFALWWFTPAASARCAIQVYVPPGGTDNHDRATSAQFFVLAGRSGTPFAQFVVDQRSQPGSWVPVGTYPVNSSGIAVQMVDRGVPGSPSAMLAVAQVKVACTG
jgi:hypothetical protein